MPRLCNAKCLNGIKGFVQEFARMLDFAWLIVWLPFFGFLFNAFAGRLFGKSRAEGR